MFLLIFSGGYDKEEKAARAYDLAALKYWGPTTTTNFPVIDNPIYSITSFFLFVYRKVCTVFVLLNNFVLDFVRFRTTRRNWKI